MNESATPPPSISQQLWNRADALRQEARTLRADPLNIAEADRLEALATEMTRQAIASDVANEGARIKADLDKWVGDNKAVADWHNENSKSLISMSQTAIRLQVTINAGAAVALLAFLGNAINKNAGTVADLFADALRVFAAGVTVAALVSISSYATQYLYGQESKRAQLWARILHGVTFAAGFISLGLFIAGCLDTYGAMRSMAKLTTSQLFLSPTTPPIVPPVQITCEVPAMAKPPETKPHFANDNAPKPFKTPAPHAQIPKPTLPSSQPSQPPAKK